MRWSALLEDETYFRPVRALFSYLRARAKGSYKTPEFWLTFAAYALPLAFLLYVLYWNFLPFGYNKTFTINVGAEGDTSGEFYLEPSESLSERKTAEDGTTYRELNGLAYAIFAPKGALKNAEITVEVEGENITVIDPLIDLDPNSVEWDYSWDFTQGKQPEELGLTGDAFPFDGCMYFDGQNKLELPDSANYFENGPFTVYAEWKPTDKDGRRQKIIGHYNWEIFQSQDEVQITLGRLNNSEGETLALAMPISPDFFNIPHTLLAIYNPSENGYFEFFVDNIFIGRTYFGTSKIWEDYGNKNFGFGESYHGNSTPFRGCVIRASIKNSALEFQTNKLTLNSLSDISLPLTSQKMRANLHKIKLTVNQNEIWGK